jgi:predicted AAA+ superfamily ATPase
MPFVIKDYIINKTFEGVIHRQRQLILDYKEDVRKYAISLDQTKIVNVFNQIPTQLAKENKKFQISKVARGAKFKDYFGAIEWLQDAGIINLCYQLNSPSLPLRGNVDTNKYKIYFADTGLLVAMLDDESANDLRVNKNMGVYKGGLYENMIGEALYKQGYELYYYKRENSTLEQDFFVRNTDSLIPIEVKSSNNKAKSLRELIKSERYPDIKFGIKFVNGNIGFQDNIYTFPFFCAFLLRRYLEEK